jgi:hypothetical protein
MPKPIANRPTPETNNISKRIPLFVRYSEKLDPRLPNAICIGALIQVGADLDLYTIYKAEFDNFYT